MRCAICIQGFHFMKLVMMEFNGEHMNGGVNETITPQTGPAGLRRSQFKVSSSHRTAAAQQWCRPSSAPGCGPVSCSTATSGHDGRGSAPVPECVRSRGRSPWTGCVPCGRSASTSPPCRNGPPPGEAGRRAPELLLRVKEGGANQRLRVVKPQMSNGGLIQNPVFDSS